MFRRRFAAVRAGSREPRIRSCGSHGPPRPGRGRRDGLRPPRTRPADPAGRRVTNSLCVPGPPSTARSSDRTSRRSAGSGPLARGARRPRRAGHGGRRRYGQRSGRQDRSRSRRRRPRRDRQRSPSAARHRGGEVERRDGGRAPGTPPAHPYSAHHARHRDGGDPSALLQRRGLHRRTAPPRRERPRHPADRPDSPLPRRVTGDRGRGAMRPEQGARVTVKGPIHRRG